MLPNAEIDRLAAAVDRAQSLASIGLVGAGYRCLSFGLLRARSLRHRGPDWAEELVIGWQQVCDDYIHAHGIRTLVTS